MHPKFSSAPAFGREVRLSPVASRVLAVYLLLTLTLLVAKVVADDHDATVATDDLALVADLLHAWLYLHDSFSLLQFFLLLVVGTTCSDT